MQDFFKNAMFLCTIFSVMPNVLTQGGLLFTRQSMLFYVSLLLLLLLLLLLFTSNDFSHFILVSIFAHFECQYILTLDKRPIKLRKCPDMTISVNWNVKHQFKQTFLYLACDGCLCSWSTVYIQGPYMTFNLVGAVKC